MYLPSAIADDWVKKGCHVNIGGVELTVAPDHKGGFVIRPVFSNTSDTQAKEAIKTVLDYLSNAVVRERWIKTIRRAIDYMRGYEGELKSKANGRMLEFKFLILALQRYEA